MKLTVPNIIKAIDLSEYAPEFGDQKIYVWVNPTRETRQELTDVIINPDAVTDDALANWLSIIWSQGPEGEGLTPDEVKEFGLECAERAPQLWAWLIVKTIHMLTEHYTGKKKSTP